MIVFVDGLMEDGIKYDCCFVFEIVFKFFVFMFEIVMWDYVCEVEYLVISEEEFVSFWDVMECFIVFGGIVCCFYESFVVKS